MAARGSAYSGFEDRLTSAACSPQNGPTVSDRNSGTKNSQPSEPSIALFPAFSARWT